MSSYQPPTRCRRRMGCSFSWQHAWQLLGVRESQFCRQKPLVVWRVGSTLMIPKAQQIFAADQQLWVIDVPGNTQFLCFFLGGGGGWKWRSWVVRVRLFLVWHDFSDVITTFLIHCTKCYYVLEHIWKGTKTSVFFPNLSPPFFGDARDQLCGEFCWKYTLDPIPPTK